MRKQFSFINYPGQLVRFFSGIKALTAISNHLKMYLKLMNLTEPILMALKCQWIE